MLSCGMIAIGNFRSITLVVARLTEYFIVSNTFGDTSKTDHFLELLQVASPLARRLLQDQTKYSLFRKNSAPSQ